MQQRIPNTGAHELMGYGPGGLPQARISLQILLPPHSPPVPVTEPPRQQPLSTHGRTAPCSRRCHPSPLCHQHPWHRRWRRGTARAAVTGRGTSTNPTVPRSAPCPGEGRAVTWGDTRATAPPLDALLVLRGQELGDAVGDEADGGQGHGRALAEGEDVEEQLQVGGRPEGVEEVQDEQRGGGAAQAERQLPALLPPAALQVHVGVEGQPQPEEDAQVAEEAGEGGGVDVDPLGVVAPPLRLLQGPEQVHAERPQQQVEAQGEAEEEGGDAQVPAEAGVVDGADVLEGLGHHHACGERRQRCSELGGLLRGQSTPTATAAPRESPAPSPLAASPHGSPRHGKRPQLFCWGAAVG